MKKKKLLSHEKNQISTVKSEPNALFQDIRKLITTARSMVARNVNILQVLTNFEIGRRIVEEEQKGFVRAKYGTQIITELSKRLTTEFGRGFSRSNLEYMRKFYQMYQSRVSGISQTASGKSEPYQNLQAINEKGGKPFVKTKEENATVGIILCQKKRDALVEITLPADANIHAKEYQLYLPGKEELRQKLIDWTTESE